MTLFNRAYLKQNLNIGSKVTIFGKIDKNLRNVVASEVRFSSLLKETIEPIYHTTNGITVTKLAQWIDQALKNDFYVMDYIPKEYVEKYHFMNKK